MYKKRQHNSIYFRHFYPHVQKAEPRAAESFSAITKRFIRFTPSLSAETQPVFTGCVSHTSFHLKFTWGITNRHHDHGFLYFINPRLQQCMGDVIIV